MGLIKLYELIIEEKMKILNKLRSGLIQLAIALVIMVSSTANAAPIISGSLGLTGGNPDIQSNFLTFEYADASDQFDIFSVFGGSQLTVNGLTQNIYDSSFAISGTANSSSADLNLLISGALVSGASTETLIAGTLTSMSNSGSGVFEFIFGGLTGSLAALYGTEAGVIFTEGSLSQFNFSDFASSMSGNSDAFGITQVSAPATFSLSLLGLALLMMARRSKACQA